MVTEAWVISTAHRSGPSSRATGSPWESSSESIHPVCAFAKRKAFWGGLGSREPEGPGLLARLWMKEEPSRPFPFAPEGRQKGGGESGKRATCPLANSQAHYLEQVPGRLINALRCRELLLSCTWRKIRPHF